MPLIFIFTSLAKCISTDVHSFTHVPKISDGGLALSLFSFKKILIRDLKKMSSTSAIVSYAGSGRL